MARKKIPAVKTPESAQSALRRNAAARLAAGSQQAAAAPETDVQRLIHELQVHQIELAMQNQELARTRAEVEAGLKQYADLYDFAPVGYFTLARDGTIQLANLAGASLLGRERGALLKQRFGTFVSSASWPAFDACFEKIFSAPDKQTCDLELLGNGSEACWVQMAGASADGQICRLVIQDISAGKQAEAALAESQGRLKALFDNTQDAVLLANDEARYVDAYPAACALLGYSREELLSMTVWNLTPLSNRKLGQELWRAFIATGWQSGEYTLHCKNGTTLEADYRAVASILPGLHLVTIRAISQRKQREDTQRLQIAALNAAANAIVITNRDGIIEWVNTAFSAATGYTLAEAAGRRPGDLLKSGKHSPQFYKAMWGTILAGQVWHGEMTNRRKDGSLFTEEQTITPLRGADGGTLHFIAIKQDITARKQAEENLRRRLAELETLHKVSIAPTGAHASLAHDR